MKAAVTFAALFASAASLAVAPPLDLEEIGNHRADAPGTGKEPTVDDTSTRSQWVTKYKHAGQRGNEPTVDDTSTRGQWVNKYKSAMPDMGVAVDETSTRGKWVSKYKVAEEANFGHWLPTGPNYLDIETLDAGYHAHSMVAYDSSSWLQSKVLVVKRFVSGRL